VKICILGPKEKKQQELWLIEEAKKRFDKVTYAQIPDVRVHNSEAYVNGTKLSSYDCILPRIPRTYVMYGYLLAKLMEGRVSMPLIPESVVLSHDKFLTLLRLKKLGIPAPQSYLGFSTSVFKAILDKMQYPVVIKLVQGSLGKGVMFAESKSSAVPLLDTMEAMKQPIMVEEYIKNPGEDIRALVIGDEVIAMKRKAQEGEKRANIGIGGTGKKIKLSYEERKMALRSARALGLGIAGVDIIQGDKGPLVIEVNVNVHFEGITQATELNIAGMMLDYVKKEAEEFKKGGGESKAGFLKVFEGIVHK
jgi:ribosomal protein S6--L-glutamate ligase